MLKNIRYYVSIVILIAPIFILSIFMQLRVLSLLFFPIILVVFIGISTEDLDREIKFEMILEEKDER